MSEIEKVKQEVKTDVAAIEAAKRKAMAALNREESWIETHPRSVTWIVIGLLAIVIGVLAKSCG
jgi:hypothetical protein